MAQRVVIAGQIPTGFRLELEATVSEAHRRQVEVTQQPVETGSNLTDHIRFGAREIDILGVISNTPLLQLVGKPSVSGGDPSRRAESAFTALERVQQTGTLCSITTTLVTYENMCLSSLAVTRDAMRGNIVELQMTWTEVRFAETLKVELPKEVQRKKKLGKQGTKPATDKAKEQLVSVLRSTY